MGQAEDFILAHSNAPYDPKKAHEYYLRTRELKGRRPASPQKPSTGGGKERAKKAETTRIAHLRKKAAHERAKIQKRLKAYLNQVDLADPMTANLKVRAFEVKNHKGAAAADLAKLAKDLKSAVAKAEAKYKHELARLRAKR
jgi:hypothetical protein